MAASTRSSTTPGIPIQSYAKLIPASRKKILMVGSSGCGKTTLLNLFGQGQQQQISAEPAVFNEMVVKVRVTPTDIANLTVCDTSGRDEYRTFQHLSFKGAKVVLACFAVNDPHTLTELQTRFLPDIARFARRTHVIVVGCKADLRCAYPNSVPFTQAWEFSRSVGAIRYIETSSKWSANYCEPFSYAAKLLMFKSHPDLNQDPIVQFSYGSSVSFQSRSKPNCTIS
ncbi:hypothetical protein DSO57_1024078 [Entomophthora muscae]|uniref:Uncharacterized protein n=1 Tax=Entomophthora muscae TaxID=34485 RepID=A0ACC2RTN9_9FUNG|nr:hypothetical protein DSO57_1024078 [Entomophthora muscae]